MLALAMTDLAMTDLPSPRITVAIRIGSMFETSGNIASLGNQGYEGAQVVLDQINKAGGINGRPIELIQINTESDETKSVTGGQAPA